MDLDAAAGPGAGADPVGGEPEDPERPAGVGVQRGRVGQLRPPAVFQGLGQVDLQQPGVVAGGDPLGRGVQRGGFPGVFFREDRDDLGAAFIPEGQQQRRAGLGVQPDAQRLGDGGLLGAQPRVAGVGTQDGVPDGAGPRVGAADPDDQLPRHVGQLHVARAVGDAFVAGEVFHERVAVGVDLPGAAGVQVAGLDVQLLAQQRVGLVAQVVAVHVQQRGELAVPPGFAGLPLAGPVAVALRGGDGPVAGEPPPGAGGERGPRPGDPPGGEPSAEGSEGGGGGDPSPGQDGEGGGLSPADLVRVGGVPDVPGVRGGHHGDRGERGDPRRPGTDRVQAGAEDPQAGRGERDGAVQRGFAAPLPQPGGQAGGLVVTPTIEHAA